MSDNGSDSARASTRTEERLRQWESCFERTTRGIAIVDPESSLLKAANPALAAMHGVGVDDLVGRPLAALATEDGTERLPEIAERAHRTGFVSYECEHRRADGSAFPVRVEVTSVEDDEGRPDYRIHWFEDLSEQREADQERHELRRDFEIAFEEAPNAVAIVDLEGRFERVNPKLCDLLGYTVEEMGSITFQEITHPDDLEADLGYVEALLAAEIPSYQMEKRYYTKWGHQIWVQLSVSLVRDGDGEPRHFISHIEDISQRKRMEQNLRELADRDSITGLMNRRRFEEELDRQAQRCSRYGEQVSLIMIDLDGFKQVNDSRGHRAGDLVIRAVGRGLADRMRRSDTVARLGGDEFAVLLLNIAEEEALRIAEQARERIADDGRNRGDGITASIGLVHFEGGPLNADDMLVAADQAMYAAKRAGRNRVSTRPR